MLNDSSLFLEFPGEGRLKRLPPLEGATGEPPRAGIAAPNEDPLAVGCAGRACDADDRPSKDVAPRLFQQEEHIFGEVGEEPGHGRAHTTTGRSSWKNSSDPW